MEQHAGRLHRDYKGKHDVIIDVFRGCKRIVGTE